MKNPPDDSISMIDRELTQPQQNFVSFLYCVSKVDLNMCMSIHDHSRGQIDGTEGNEKNNTFLNYCTTQPEAAIHDKKSDIQLDIYSEASYLS